MVQRLHFKCSSQTAEGQKFFEIRKNSIMRSAMFQAMSGDEITTSSSSIILFLGTNIAYRELVTVLTPAQKVNGVTLRAAP